MFKNNKYTKIYNLLLNQAKNRIYDGYTEKHHIIPRSLGGSNDLENIVKLTAREHFICHLLLIKMVDDDSKSKMVYAAWQQSRSAKLNGVKITSRRYEVLRKQLSETYKGRKRKPFSQEWRDNMRKRAVGNKNNMYGKTHTDFAKQKISEKLKGRYVGANNPFYGKTHSDTVKEKTRETNKKTHICPHCGKQGQSNVMKRFHFDKCKTRNYFVSS
jgi:hypothetical protein